MCPEVDPLTAFLALIPYADRKRATVKILKIRKYLHDQIENTASFSRPATLIRNLKPIFTHLPITLRRSLKEKIFAAFEQSLESSEALAVFTILLSIIETCSIRNSDRCDLEKDDIFKSLSSLIPILNNISQSIISRNTNLLSCRAWVVAMLVYTYRECLIWCSHQDCLDLTKEGLDELVPIESLFYDSPSVPKILRIALDCQRNTKPPPSTNLNYSFHELLLLSAFSDHTSNFIFANITSNFFENRFDESCNTLKFPLSVKVCSKCQSLPALQEVQKSIESKDLVKIHGNLELIDRSILDNVPLQGDFKQICKEMIKNAPIILDTMVRKMEEIEKVPHDLQSLYSGLLCGFLRVWIHALERRLVLEEIPQSYFYLSCFMNIRYQDMILKDFAQSICVISNFLTTYGRIFKANILASPYWFLQMLKDSLTAVIDRLSSATDEEELTTLEYAICPCIASISRTWASLHAEESDSRPEMSRSIQGLLHTVSANIAAATVPVTTAGKKRKWNEEKVSTENAKECSALRPRVRQMLNKGMIFPLLDAIDPWTLQQSRIGLRPASACEVLKTLITAHEERKRLVVGEEEADAVISRSRVSAPVAVTGLSGERLKAKAAAKRQKRIREQRVL